MNFEIGLKLYSTNTKSIKAVEAMHRENVFDYIELMPIPGSYSRTISAWKGLNIPVVIHAPHSSHGFNLSDKKSRSRNLKMFVEVKKFADSLTSDYIIMHPGLTGEAEETVEQIKIMNDKRILVENMPFVSLMGTKCIGSSRGK